MKYPIVRREALRDAVRLRRGRSADLDQIVEWVGAGEELELAALEAVEERLPSLLTTPSKASTIDRDRTEGEVGTLLFEGLGGLPLVVLDDPAFWSYVGVAHLWTFVVWREPQAFASGDYRLYRRYMDGLSPAECVALRAFLRGRLAATAGDPSLGVAVPRGADFWRSHVLRVRTATAPHLVGALAWSHADDRMPTKELRARARDLNRLWTNVVLNLYTEQEAAQLIAELREIEPRSAR